MFQSGPALELARALQAALPREEPPAPQPGVPDPGFLYDALITDEDLRAVSHHLFRDRHYAQAVEEGFKYLEKLVRDRAGVEAHGAAAMTSAFSLTAPRLKMARELKSDSAKNKQVGYMKLLEGAMTGIRNPRAHTPGHPDDARDAIELLVFCNHLVRTVKQCRRARPRRGRRAPGRA